MIRPLLSIIKAKYAMDGKYCDSMSTFGIDGKCSRMRIINQYLDMQGISDGRISELPSKRLGLVVVIPAYKEENIIHTLDSLSACELPDCGVEILVYVNGSLSDSQEIRDLNEQAYEALKNYVSKANLIIRHLKNLDLPDGGVGLARKTLMDEAVYRLSQVGTDGIIVNLDADCTVAPNYLKETYSYFQGSSKVQAASLHFEHALEGSEIVDYELHLRYFIGMQRYYEFPFAFHTVGSAMAVRASGYAKVGGMNRRKAGEDFYFLHKFIKNEDCGELTTTVVYPSGRVSDRVPFGTGKAVGKIKEEGFLKTYNPESFMILSGLARCVKALYYGEEVVFHKDLPPFLVQIRFHDKVTEIRANTRNLKSFRKRYFQYIDAFQLMKALHFLRDVGYDDVEIEAGLNKYFAMLNLNPTGDRTEDLLLLRKKDRSYG